MIYSFRYDVPITNIPYWDRSPLVVVLFENDINMMGINLHWLPPNLIPLFIRYCNSMLRKQMGQMVLRLFYNQMKNSGAHFALIALRKYKKNRMRNIVPIDVMIVRTKPRDLFKYRPILARRL